MQPLTPKQQRLFEFVSQYIIDHGYVPTTKECAFALGQNSHGAVHREIGKICDKGHLHWEKRRLRSVRLVVSSHQAAGEPDQVLEAAP